MESHVALHTSGVTLTTPYASIECRLDLDDMANTSAMQCLMTFLNSVKIMTLNKHKVCALSSLDSKYCKLLVLVMLLVNKLHMITHFFLIFFILVT